MRGLYEASAAVVMPTYFGPTNLPPLEAWLTEKPLIYSSHLKEHSGDAAISVNPDDVNELAIAMKKCAETEDMSTLIEFGKLRLLQIDEQRVATEAELTNRLQQFEIIRKCWE